MQEQSLQPFLGAFITFLFGGFAFSIKLVYDHLHGRIKDIIVSMETHRVEKNATAAALGMRMDAIEHRIAEIVDANFALHRQDSERQERMLADIAASKATMVALKDAIEQMSRIIERRM